MVAAAEAEAARQHAVRHGQFSTPLEEYGHMPAPTRIGLSTITEWVLTSHVHEDFSKSCRLAGNQTLWLGAQKGRMGSQR